MKYMPLGLEISAISILAVFLTLYVLAILIDVFKVFLGPKKKQPLQEKSKVGGDRLKPSLDAEDELVAVITAAIAAYQEDN